ncbi:MAG: ATP-binding protein [Opitutaceae bacterium]|jgi:signal transduction histidine kinase|nr:ATP-binding protein [Opitutaceae bacterium]
MQEPNDYFVDLAVQSEINEDAVLIPLVFKDVMRDLIANSRKYSPLGASIIVGLYETSDALKFVVQDTGRGIPEEEIQRVFEYGSRGSNVEGVRTMGGGFGLTKAFYVTKQFGGRFWIKSAVDQGTRIRIELPRPA